MVAESIIVTYVIGMSTHRSLRIGWIGGITRAEGRYAEVAHRMGHAIEFHTGHVNGNGSSALWRLAGRVDVMIVLTDVNSHRGVLTAKEAARSAGIPCVLLRTCGPSRFEEVLRGLDGKKAA